MKYVKTVAVCAVVALGVGATSATAGSLITSAKIKDGSIQMRDLAPGVKAKLKHATTSKAGATGPSGVNGANGAPGARGETGAAGANGTKGVDGKDGKDGRDGVRYDRIVGSCDGPQEGEVSIANGTARLGAPTQMSWAQIRSYPKNLTVAEIDKLTFSAKASDEGMTYLKVTTTGHGSIVFSPNTQAAGERVGEMTTYDVRNGTSRWNDDAGESPDFTWGEILEKAGNEHVKTIGVIAGCANGDGGETLVDDLTVNDEVIDFN